MAIRPIFEIVEEAKKDIENLDCDDLEKEIESDEKPLLVDIREIQEYVDYGTIPDAVHAPRGMLEFWADPSSPYFRGNFTQDRRIVLFCAAGGRSALAVKSLEEMGFSNVAHLEPGFNGWAKAKKPIQETATRSRWMRKLRGL